MNSTLNNGVETEMNSARRNASSYVPGQPGAEPCGEQLVCWWSPSGFTVPYCAFAAGLGQSVRCCMQTAGARAPWLCDSRNEQEHGDDHQSTNDYYPR